MDILGYPVVIPKGSVFVTAGTDRRSSGTHYTPLSLTEPIVQYTLEPLVYVGPAEGLPKGQWKLRSAKEILDLKICDMACGSAAFLVQAYRYLSERLLEAWEKEIATEATENTEKKKKGIIGFLDLSSGLLSSPSVSSVSSVAISPPDELQVYARRIIAQRCLYGVDKNPLGVEMAKLSLWLLTLAKDKPFGFLDHAIRCGDSLVGIHHLDQLKHFNLDPSQGRNLFTGPIFNLVDDAVALRQKIEAMPGCGGLRKVRLADPRRRTGKRGGLRVIYLHVPEAGWMLLLDMYEKGEKEDLAPAEKKVLKKLAEQFKAEAIRTTSRQSKRNSHE